MSKNTTAMKNRLSTVFTGKAPSEGEGRALPPGQGESQSTTTQTVQNKAPVSRKRPFNLILPEELYNRLNYYVKNYALRHESMNRIVVDALSSRIAELEKEKGITAG